MTPALSVLASDVFRMSMSARAASRSRPPHGEQVVSRVSERPGQQVDSAFMSDLLVIANEGAAITRTNYWSSPAARAGYLYLSAAAGALRILVPAPTEPRLAELPPTGTPVEISDDIVNNRPVYRLAWLTDPAHPYQIAIDQRHGNGALPESEDGRVVPLVWYVASGESGVVEHRREDVRIARAVEP